MCCVYGHGLIYMRARYYSSDMRRFVNADVLHGEISDSTSLNRYSYVNGNPVSFVDPFGLEAERGYTISTLQGFNWENFTEKCSVIDQTISFMLDENQLEVLYKQLQKSISTAERPNNIAAGQWSKIVQNDIDWVENTFDPTSQLAKTLKGVSYASIAFDVLTNIQDIHLDIKSGTDPIVAVSDAAVDVGVSALGGYLSCAFATATATAIAGTAVGSAVPGLGNAIGAFAGFIFGMVYFKVYEGVEKHL